MNTLNRLFSPLRAGLVLLAFALCAPAALGQMPQQDTTQLSSSDVSDEEVQKAARIAVALQMSGRQMRMEMQKEMKQKYGNPQEMDSTEKANMKRDRQRQMKQMRKEQMKMMQQKTQEEELDVKRFQRIMQAARQDSTLQKRLQMAMKAEMKKQQPEMQGGQGGGGGTSGQ